MVESLEALYGKYNADKDVMFGITSEVCMCSKSTPNGKTAQNVHSTLIAKQSIYIYI